jgi:hypothetical protein
MKIVELLINNQINSFIKYRKGAKDIHSGIQNHFKTALRDSNSGSHRFQGYCQRDGQGDA